MGVTMKAVILISFLVLVFASLQSSNGENRIVGYKGQVGEALDRQNRDAGNKLQKKGKKNVRKHRKSKGNRRKSGKSRKKQKKSISKRRLRKTSRTGKKPTKKTKKK